MIPPSREFHYQKVIRHRWLNQSSRFSIEYASLTGANGTVAMDQVTVAGLTVPNQAFGAVTNSIGNFTYAVSVLHLSHTIPR